MKLGAAALIVELCEKLEANSLGLAIEKSEGFDLGAYCVARADSVSPNVAILINSKWPRFVSYTITPRSAYTTRLVYDTADDVWMVGMYDLRFWLNTEAGKAIWSDAGIEWSTPSRDATYGDFWESAPTKPNAAEREYISNKFSTMYIATVSGCLPWQMLQAFKSADEFKPAAYR